jgi:hypothetical protein
MLHLPGSLANLCKGFFPNNVEARKGHFPHLFNTVENFNYIGPIPDLKYFDLAFMAKDQKQVDEFTAWHEARRLDPSPWNFQKELLEYCRNDVFMLSKLVREYHDICVETFKLSPWHRTTAPSYVHEVVKRQVSHNYELPPDTKSEEYAARVNDLAWKEGWGVLRANEYWFARAALRGGRTEVRKIHHLVSDEDWAAGVRIRYQDIVSMYPYVQVAYDYPVGLPQICVYDDACYPCANHRNPKFGNYIRPNCFCAMDRSTGNIYNEDGSYMSHEDAAKLKHGERMFKAKLHDPFRDRTLDILRVNVAPSAEEILVDDDFFGIVCASLTPPTNLFHPVLVTWDDEAQKCTGSLNPIKYGVFTSVEFKKALQKGYRLDKLHRLDKYRKAPGLWNDFIKQLYVFKMANSEAAPATVEEQMLLADQYEEDFDMGDAVMQSFSDWAKRPAKRQVFKIMLNSGWGKHAQRPKLPSLKIIGENDHRTQDDFLMNVSEEIFKLKSYQYIGGKIVSRVETNGKVTQPNFHDAYLPAGLFVPAYGRMMLYEQLEKLDERVLYHDTDSIVYIFDPRKYNIPESPVWGRWSVEDVDFKNGGIREFVGVGPKSYGIRADNGFNFIKVKGLSLKRAHEGMLNFDVMKGLIMHFLETGDSSNSVSLPQFTFDYKIGLGLTTVSFLKLFSFQPENLKGDLIGDTLYPYGYIHQ